MNVANQKYKDTVFRTLFNDPKQLASLYHAIHPEEIVLPEDIQINTLDDDLFDSQKNDLSFLYKKKSIILMEHQSTKSQNLPLRMFFYLARLLEKGIEHKAMYKTKLLKMPAPHFYVFYIGRGMQEDEDTLDLKDAFEESSDDLNLRCHMINITYDAHRRILEAWQPLHDYSFFMQRIWENRESGMSLDEAIRKAVEYCFDHQILADYLEKYREEVADMITWKWNEDEALEVRAEEAREEGALQKSLEIIKNMLRMKLPYDTIAKSTATPLDEVMRIAREQNMVY